MVTRLLSLHFLYLTAVWTLAEPIPGRIPKVYNALITSNQNLEPSKAYPVYQPVLHDAAFAFPFQPAVFYGNGLLPAPALTPRHPNALQPPPASSAENQPETKSPATQNQSPPEQSQDNANNNKEAPSPPLPPPTQSPIPLNEFGLPPQVVPLGRINPAYEGFSQVGPFTFTYPALRLYDPFDPFNVSPYAALHPLYRPFGNILGSSAPITADKEIVPAASASSSEQTSPNQTPPPEPSDLNLLNYSSKDPAIPNVPPPPLPQGGLKSDKTE